LLVVMAALILSMTMSYRAGTAFAHPHAFFQVFIDTATGHSHHDADELVAGAQPEQAGTFSPFVPPDVPLQQPRGAAGVHYRVVGGYILYSAQANSHAPDTPTLSALTAPLEQATGIPALSLIVLLLLAADRQRAIWALTRIPRGARPVLEPPPPRRLIRHPADVRTVSEMYRR
jgi:hypothetical protein